MSVYASARAPTKAQDVDWASTVGTWKIGQRDPLGPERGGCQAKPSGDTRLVSNTDPVSGRSHVGLFSVGRQGWRNQRRKEAPAWIQHQRAIAVPRELGEMKLNMSQISPTRSSNNVVCYADAMTMEGRTVLSTLTSVKTSPPHPSNVHAQRIRRLTPSEILPRRVRMQQSLARQTQDREDEVDKRSLLPTMLADNLEAAWKALNEAVSRAPAPGVRTQEFGRMLFDARWISRDSMPALMRTYACDAGIDAALVVSDLWQCIKRPGFSAARYPAPMHLLTSTILHMFGNLESRFLRSDDEALQSVKSTGARARSEEPARHIDVEVLAEHLKCSGFEVNPRVFVLLQKIYCCGEGQWKGFINYERLLADLRSAAGQYLQASSKPGTWNFDESLTPERFAQGFVGERAMRGAIKRVGRVGTGGSVGVRWEGSIEWENNEHEGGRQGTTDIWERPSTASNASRPASAESSYLSVSSRPGCQLSLLLLFELL